VADNEYSSKHYALEAKDWSNKTGSTVDGNEYSSKYYSEVSKDWANKTTGTVDGTEYSAKYYAEVAADIAHNHMHLPIGHEYFSMNPNVPQGSLPLIGGEYDRATYPDLWAWVQDQTGYCKTEAEWQTLSTANNGNVPFYSDGDGSTTFRVPSLRCWVKGANGTVTEVGSYLQAGLPNITGSLTFRPVSTPTIISTRGAFSREDASETATGGAVGSQTYDRPMAIFNASASNSIYGNSTTVQPESIVGMWLVKAYGTIEDTGQIDEQQYIDDRIADIKNTYLPANYLPKSGGTMSGGISFNSTDTLFTLNKTDIKKGVAVGTSIEPYVFKILDKNGDTISSLSNSIGSSGIVRCGLYTFPWVTGASYFGAQLYASADGTTLSWNPTSSNSTDLGYSSRRWKQLYANTATIDTSDERVKDNISAIPNDVLDAWGEVDWVQFQFNDAIAKKGENARIHCGAIAQRIKSVFESHGIDAFRYGLLCYDEWGAEEEERDEKGNVIQEAMPAGNLYSLRYEEALCMEAAYQRRRADRLEARIEALERAING